MPQVTIELRRQAGKIWSHIRQYWFVEFPDLPALFRDAAGVAQKTFLRAGRRAALIPCVALLCGPLLAAAQTPMPTFRYTFDESSVPYLSSGTLSENLNLLGTAPVPGATNGGPGSGVAQWGRAYDSTAALNQSGASSGDWRLQQAHNRPEIDGLTALTLCGWFKTSQEINGSTRFMLKLGSNKGWALLGQSGNVGNGGLNLQIGTGTNVNSVSSANHPNFGLLNQWVFFAVTWDGATTRFYTGTEMEPVAAPYDTESQATTMSAGTTLLTFGNTTSGGGPGITTNNRMFDGYFDDFRIYANTVLTDAQIEAVRQEALAGAAASSQYVSPYTNEYALVLALPPDVLATCTGGAPDTNGLVGSNQTGSFVADEQRGAMDTMVVGIASTNDNYVAQGWSAIAAAYVRQTSNGDFGGGANNMHFFMAWANHALVLLRQSSYAAAYNDRINALLPQAQLAMDYLALHGICNSSASVSESSVDYDSPNRSLINATAFLLGSVLLKDYASSNRLAAYQTAGQGWLNSVFLADHSRVANPAAPLFRAWDGVFLEPPSDLSVYGGGDTSYQAVGLSFYYYLMTYFPACTWNTYSSGLMAGRWLEKRILTNQVIDCTYNTRSGPGNQDGVQTGQYKANDLTRICFALVYYAVMFNRSAGNDAARNTIGATATNGLPPVVFSEAAATAVYGQPFSFDVLAGNAGLDTLDTTNFALVATGLSAGLTLGPNITFNKSTGSKTISGTPNAVGPLNVTIYTTNQYGAGSLSALTINVLPTTPVIASLVVSNQDLLLTCPNGVPGASYTVLATTNLSLPLSQWTLIQTQSNLNGAFILTLTNALNTPAGRQFYRLRAQ